jgi:sugar transferase (PEP-CTERM/EpsH1 system associated)
MQELLFLSHRIPYPPNKGDKIRSYHLLAHLSRRYQVHLGTFIDDPDDWRHVEAVRALCATTCFVRLERWPARLRSLTGLLTGDALTLGCYRSRRLQAWVETTLQRANVQRALVFSSAMAQFVGGPRHRGLQRVIDFVDVDSDKWLQYSRAHRWPLSWIYRREQRTLLRFERAVATEFAASVFVSAAEAALFRRLAPEAAARTTYADNGVDTDFFDPDRDYPNPYPADVPVVVFTGAMDYPANVDAVCWFAQTVWPAVLRKVPEALFCIAGARPVAVVRQLGARPGIRVTGAVPDIRPWLAHARLAAAPLRIARGVQNKVLEALAMAKPVLATPAAVAGLAPCPLLADSVTAEPERLAERAIALLTSGSNAKIGPRGRAWVLEHYDWNRNLARIESLLEPAADIAPDREPEPNRRLEGVP